jgi:hypothetical protein
MMNGTDLYRFFRNRRVAVLSIPREPGKPPLTTPVWYDWDGSAFRIQVEATSAKAKHVARLGAAPVSLAVQSEVPPYRYAVIYGQATLGPSTNPELRLQSRGAISAASREISTCATKPPPDAARTRCA